MHYHKQSNQIKRQREGLQVKIIRAKENINLATVGQTYVMHKAPNHRLKLHAIVITESEA